MLTVLDRAPVARYVARMRVWSVVSAFALCASIGCGSGSSSGAGAADGARDASAVSTADATTGDAGGASLTSSGDDAATDPIVTQGDASSRDDDAGEDDDASPISAVDAGPLGRYDADGPIALTDFDETVTSSNSSYTVHVYLPSSKREHPVVLVSSGLEQDGDAYAPYARRLASWGIVAITRDDPGLSTNATAVAADLDDVVTTWLAAENAKTTSKLFGTLDLSNVALAGHSKGGQAAFLAAEGLAKGKIRAVFGIDPVDSDSLARGSIATLGVPVAFIGETTDGSSNGCAPSADNFLVLYGNAASPAVAITAVNADHTMFEDSNDCSFCSLCTSGSASQPIVLAYAVRYVTAFFARELLGDSSVGAAFQGAGATEDSAANRIALVSK